TPPAIEGAGEVRIAAEILDGRGNRLPADGVRFTADAFTLSADGSVAVVRVPAAHEGRKSVRVTAVVPGAEGSIDVPLGAPQVRDRGAESVEADRTKAVALGALLGGQSNFAHATAAAAQLEVAAHPGIRPIEVLARVGVLQYAPASDARLGGTQRG